MPETLVSRQGLTRDNESHQYYFDGRKVSNVTRLLQDYGIIDLSGIPPKRLDFKRILGTAVDYAIHLLNERKLDEESLDPRIVPYVNAYRKFCEITGFEATHSKQMLYSKVWGFAGELDAVGSFTWKGKLYKCPIVDWKCLWQMYYSCGPQTAAYQILYEENFKEKVDGRFGIQLKPNGNFEVYPYTKQSDRNVFLSCVTIENVRRANGLLREVA